MAAASSSAVEAAVAAIRQRDQAEPAPGGRRRVDLSALRRTHHERLQSELTRAGLDLASLEKAYQAYRAEADRLLAEQAPAADSKPCKPSRGDREQARARQRAYELLAGRPLIVLPVLIDAPVAIYSQPAGALVDSHIESWNSWATWNHRDDRSTDGRQAYLKFLFAWQNDTPYPVVVRSAGADIAARGFCLARADPSWLDHTNASQGLYAYHRAHVGADQITGDHRLLLYQITHTDGWLLGGEVQMVAEDIDRTSHVRCRDVVVPGGSIAVFEVGIEADYSLGDVSSGGGEGMHQFLFAHSGRRIACPSLDLEVVLIFQP